MNEKLEKLIAAAIQMGATKASVTSPADIINVTEMMHSAGWPLKPAIHSKASDSESMTWVAGLILISGSINTTSYLKIN